MSFQILGIDHVQLAAPAGCEDESREFFGDLLGLQEIEKPPELQKRGGVWFQIGAQQLHIGVEQSFAPARKAHPGFYVENLEQLRDRLTSAGLVVKEDPLPGVNRFHVDDPFGNRLEFLER